MIPNARECALLLLSAVESKVVELNKPVSRFRISEASLLRTLGRQRLDSALLAEVQEWLLAADWVLFFAGPTYAMIKATSVEGWTRLASKRIGGELEQVRQGTFDFTKLDHLLETARSHADDEDRGFEPPRDE